MTYSSCVYINYHTYAPIIQPEAERIINQLKSDTIVIVIPTYQEKERILKNIKSRSRNNKKNKQKLLNLYAEQRIEQEAIINSFNKHYTFSEVLYMPDSLVSAFESGKDGVFFINTDNKLDSNIHYSNRKPIKLLKQFEQEWHIKTGNCMIPNPFPNYYLYRNGLYGFLGTEQYSKMYDRVAEVFQIRFEKFYADPTSRILL